MTINSVDFALVAWFAIGFLCYAAMLVMLIAGEIEEMPAEISAMDSFSKFLLVLCLGFLMTVLGPVCLSWFKFNFSLKPTK